MSNQLSVVDALPGVAFTAQGDGRVDFVSQGWTTYTGRSAADAHGRGWQSAVHPDDLPALLTGWNTSLNGTAVDIQARLLRFDGVYRWFVLRLNPLAEGQWCGLFSDIDDYRGVPAAPLAADLDLRTIIDCIPALVAFMTPDGALECVNCHNLDYLGATLEELKQWTVGATVHPDDLPGVINAWMHAVRTEQPYRNELRLRRADGAYHWFAARALPMRDTEGRITRWVLISVDIDEQKRDKALIAQALAEVSASEDRLSNIINAIPGFVWSAAPDGSVGFVNQRWCDYTGMSLDEARGIGWARSVHPEDAAPLAEYWGALLQSGEAGEFEARLRRFDDHYRWFLVRAVPQRDEWGAVMRWYGENTDIEDRKQAEMLAASIAIERQQSEETLDKVRSELAHLARVASLGAVTASIAHEVNQPLAGIITNASTCLRMLGADPPNVSGALETARRTIRDGNRAADVINRLRALFSKKTITIEDVDLNEAAREVIAMLLGELQRNGVALQPDFTDDLPAVRGDRVQLQQVILNLILNATEAMNTMTGRARHLQVSTGLNEHQGVYLAVTDNGSGFDPLDAERMFTAFYTTKHAGMGIGLSISRSIIERHAGVLSAAINDGPGATFQFSIPATREGI
ncbi:PAS domain-containing protein [Pseudomonas poae]|uniref:histidine kinase n=1 Tax=Pseudomonas poae TaxID=200451 RepID=A0A2S9DVA6_9PSED|nr:PAS domain-containing protein [Pseudomonas poae]PRA20572.1 PAS domain-containing sensor histidine kinase [Pseudomonas poae]PRC06526.1 PAS domain-containing sensor histidine kinase [Pseudomonas poae]